MRRPSFCSDVRFGLSKLTSRLGKDVVAGVFLLTCDFTDTWLLSLNSPRISWKPTLAITRLPSRLHVILAVKTLRQV